MSYFYLCKIKIFCIFFSELNESVTIISLVKSVIKLLRDVINKLIISIIVFWNIIILKMNYNYN